MLEEKAVEIYRDNPFLCIRDKDELKRGYTTGTCSAAATYGAFYQLVNGEFPEFCNIVLPKGEKIKLKPEDKKVDDKTASCAIMKFSGDDPDVTNGTYVYSEIRLIDKKEFLLKREDNSYITIGERFILKAGKGVGIVTKAGLACDIGKPAINPVPQKMIKEVLENLANIYGFEGYAQITISIPKGIELAQRTFNPKLGIVGGISVLGTTGIVEPMSEKALIDTIKVEIDVIKAQGADKIVITPGNYGKDFLDKNTEIKEESCVKCSNFIGEAISYAVKKGFSHIILSGHLGKLIKVSDGILNTHSKYGDERMRIICDLLKELNTDNRIVDEISKCVMVDEAVRILEELGLKTKIMNLVGENILKVLRNEAEKLEKTNIKFDVIVFSNKYGLLYISDKHIVV